MSIKIFLSAALMMAWIAANASDTDWQWQFGQGYFAHFGTSISASDGADAQDVRISGIQYWYVGTYHEQGTDGWTAPTGFYSTDIRAPLSLAPGQSKTWTFYAWCDPSYTDNRLEIMWGFNSPRPSDKMLYTLTYVKAADGEAQGTLAVGTSVILNQYPQGTWRFPTYKTTDGLTGYVFDFTATVIPEPSGLVALATALAGAGGVWMKRRKR